MNTLHNRIVGRVRHDFMTDCWIWTGATQAKGYGTIENGGRRGLLVHRVAYDLWVSPIPDGAQVHHECRTKSCVNPAHLRALTPGEHARQHAAERTSCPSGHAWDETNTSLTTKGHRRCKACARERWRSSYAPKGRNHLAASPTCANCGRNRVRISNRMTCHPCESSRKSASQREARRRPLQGDASTDGQGG